ncbi:MAG TPA: hypothetical protein VLG28_00270 [Acidimicrobiia bacterium]|nr:hypothetical protein [Acidimicrobiia bacterium]
MLATDKGLPIVGKHVLEIGSDKGEPPGWLSIPRSGDPELAIGNPLPCEINELTDEVHTGRLDREPTLPHPLRHRLEEQPVGAANVEIRAAAMYAVGEQRLVSSQRAAPDDRPDC